jgi:GTP pyrophosphokinase
MPSVGYITRGRGLTVHRRDCDNLRQLAAAEPARLMEVAWAEASPEDAYPVDLIIVAADRKGLLRDISAVFSEADLTLLGVNTSTDRTSDRATMRFTAEVRDMDQLETLQSRLRQIPDVIAVKRPR